MKYFESLQKTIKAWLKYFRFDLWSPKNTAIPTDDAPVNAGSETERKEEVVIVSRGIMSSKAVKRPPRPKVRSGGGGQIHTAYK
ncbi:hypothetical protein KSS87_019297 [Heliosperma pusillum]|nr:hypothetical protein KSS87_019297 [Heliosperma pusillum]